MWRKSIRVRERRLLVSLAVSTFIGDKLLALHDAAETAFEYFAKAGYLHDRPRLPDRHPRTVVGGYRWSRIICAANPAARPNVMLSVPNSDSRRFTKVHHQSGASGL